MNRIFLALLATCAILLSSLDAEAAGRGWRWRRPAKPAPSARPPQFPDSEKQQPARWPEDYYRAIYPKYYGGFHVRQLENIGIPSGDIGLRGNGLYWTPW